LPKKRVEIQMGTKYEIFFMNNIPLNSSENYLKVIQYEYIQRSLNNFDHCNHGVFENYIYGQTIDKLRLTHVHNLIYIIRCIKHETLMLLYSL